MSRIAALGKMGRHSLRGRGFTLKRGVQAAIKLWIRRRAQNQRLAPSGSLQMVCLPGKTPLRESVAIFAERKATVLAIIAITSLIGCAAKDDGSTHITLWHQMVPAERVVLDEAIAKFESANADVEVRALYKETEELRNGFQAAVLAGVGPELIYGPSDAIGPFQRMRIIQDMSQWLPVAEQAGFVDESLIRPARNRRRVDRAAADRRQDW